MLRFLQRRRKRDEHGVVAIVLALIACFVLIPVAALAVDIGVQRVARSDMQSLADVVAMDLARHLDGEKSAADLNAGGTTMQERAEASRDKNTATVGEKPTVVAELGTYDLVTDSFEALPEDSAETPNAVRVTAATAVDFGFMPGSGGTARSAIAQAHTSACFQLGSWAATLDPSASQLFGDVLGQLLGTSTLTAAGYNGLATAELSLLDLVQTEYVGVGTVHELLELEHLTAGDLFRASAKVLRGQGKVLEAQVFDLAAASIVAPMVIDLGELIGLSTANEAALQTRFNALDLLIGTAFLANGENGLDLPNLQAGLGSIGVTNTSLKIIERARRACNLDEARTAQVKLVSQAKVNINSSPIINVPNLAKVNLTQTSIDMGIDLELAGARGQLTNVSCNPDVFDVDVWTDLIRARVSGTATMEGSVKLDLNLLGIPLAGVDVPVKYDIAIVADASKPASTAPTHVQQSFPPSTYGEHVSVGSGGIVLPDVSVSVLPGSLQIQALTVKVLGVPITVPVGDLVNPVLHILNPLVQDLGGTAGAIGSIVNPLIAKLNGIVDQLSTGLGINLAGADVYGLPAPTCQTPVIRK